MIVRLSATRALVVGGTSGIGAAIVERLAADGARVVLTGRDRDRGQTLAERTGAAFVAADVLDEDAVRASVEEALETLGGLDALIYSAGTIYDAPLTETPLEAWTTLVDTNLTGAYLYSVACLPALREAGGGTIVHLASDVGVWGDSGLGAYSVTKAALITLAQMLAIEAGPDGIRVNAVCPGGIAPGMRTTAGGSERGEVTSGWIVPPVGRVGEGEDVAALVAFLVGPDSAFVSGAALLVDGGMRAGYRAGRPQ